MRLFALLTVLVSSLTLGYLFTASYGKPVKVASPSPSVESPASPTPTGLVQAPSLVREDPREVESSQVAGGETLLASRHACKAVKLEDLMLTPVEEVRSKISGLGIVDTTEDELKIEVMILRKRIAHLEVELALTGKGDSPIANWINTIEPYEIPKDEEDFHTMAMFMSDVPVDWSTEDGFWLYDRIQLNDWSSWGETWHKAIVAFIGRDRIHEELDPDQLAVLQAAHPELLQ